MRLPFPSIRCVPAFLAILSVASLFGDDDAAPVTVTAIGTDVVEESLELTGTVTAERRSSLSARTAGLVRILHVDAGSRVRKGDLLLELDSALAALALERAEEALRQASTRLSELERLFEEGQKLVASGGIPRTEAEARRAAFQGQQAAVRQLQVDVREAAEIVDRHRLRAPFPGVISEKLTEAGEWVETGVPVLELVEVDAVRFDAQAPQERYAAIQEKTTATVRLDSVPGEEFSARLLTKVPVKDAVARMFLVRLTVDAPQGVMAPGTSGTAIFRIPSRAGALTMERDALVRLPDGSTMVWVVQEGENGRASVEARPVQVGERMGSTVEVKTGVKAGERVVLRGNETLRPGQPVRILPDSPSEEPAG